MPLATFVEDENSNKFVRYWEAQGDYPNAKRIIIEDVQADTFKTLQYWDLREVEDIVSTYLG